MGLRRSPHLADELREKEAAFLRERRADPPVGGEGEVRNVVGLAFSGGGIRSATISIGILQGLARLKLLRAIDYVSTVSGGGYAGTFLGGMFSRWRKSVTPLRESQRDAVEEALRSPHGHPIDWLRENGRYLAPNGASDMWVATAVVLRNLCAIHVILGTFVVALLLSANRIRIFSADYIESVLPDLSKALADIALTHSMWWSPILVLPLLMFLLWMLPLGIAFWLVLPGKNKPGIENRDRIAPWIPVAALFLFAAFVAYRSIPSPSASASLIAWTVPLVSGGAAIVMVLTLVWWWVSERKGSPEQAGNVLTLRLKVAVVTTLSFAAFGLLDSIGQTLYVVWFAGHSIGAVVSWISGGFGALAGIATFTQRVFGVLIAKSGTKRKLPLELIGTLAAFLLVAAMVSSLSALAHALTWQWEPPDAPKVSAVEKYSVTFDPPRGAHIHEVLAPSAACGTGGDRGDAPLCHPETVAWARLRWALILAWVLTLAFGQSYSFLNRSSLAGLYGARLARCYLGASNETREQSENKNVTITLHDDEVELPDYKPWTRGGPLHIVNATLNETVSGRSQVEQRDRKGMALALGPAGLSVGVRHHAVWQDDKRRTLVPTHEPSVPNGGPMPFRVFPRVVHRDEAAQPGVTGTPEAFTPAMPSMGAWMAISGAAVSTGLGSRTSAGLSLLIGLFNVRLGQWFRSGVKPSMRKAPKHSRASRSTVPSASGEASRARGLTSTVLRACQRVLPVHAYFFNELLARFPGVALVDWYLSDGGHFENTGAYELVRRRVPFIILCDNGADPDRTFDDLGNFVRKARTDFDAHVEFLGREDVAGTGKAAVLGTLADLGFAGTIAAADLTEKHPPKSERSDAAEVSSERIKPARYATVARITYDGTTETSVLVVLKPAVLGQEPLDILNYQLANPTFPQQSTGDQFFDDAQWEAHRRLGECMASRVFSAFDKCQDPNDGWKPFDIGNPPTGTS